MGEGPEAAGEPAPPDSGEHDAAGTALDEFNERLLEAVNATGEVYLSHTRLDGRYALRLAIGNIRTRRTHVARAWELLRRESARLLREEGAAP
jgi:aromatic-L-amino-acid decarboxylase